MDTQVDHYEYWNKVRGNDTRKLYREKTVLSLLDGVLKKGMLFLDVGCGNGKFMKFVQEQHPDAKLKGVDFSRAEVKEAKREGLDVIWGDFERGTSLKTGAYDVVYSGEVIEHLYNPDAYLEEISRIMKDKGHLIIATPNLLAWFNRILAVVGVQPLFLEMSTRSKLIGSGFLKRFKKEPQPVGHIRIFTKRALYDILEEHGFEVITLRGGIYDEGFPRALWGIERLFALYPSLSSQLIVLARKKPGRKKSGSKRSKA